MVQIGEQAAGALSRMVKMHDRKAGKDKAAEADKADKASRQDRPSSR